MACCSSFEIVARQRVIASPTLHNAIFSPMLQWSAPSISISVLCLEVDWLYIGIEWFEVEVMQSLLPEIISSGMVRLMSAVDASALVNRGVSSTTDLIVPGLSDAASHDDPPPMLCPMAQFMVSTRL